jgi:hypothetical protein
MVNVQSGFVSMRLGRKDDAHFAKRVEKAR